MSGTILLGAVAARTEQIEISCRACARHGKLWTEKLVAEHGPEMPMPQLLRLLAGDCPHLDAQNIAKRCDVHCPTLSELFTF